MKKLVLLPACLVGLAVTVNAQVKDPPPPPPPPRPPIIVEVTQYVPPAKELKDFYTRNPDVASVFWKSDRDVVVVHKDKTKFVYNMKNKEENDAFHEKYGDAVIKAPQPPPPPPPPPKKVS